MLRYLEETGPAMLVLGCPQSDTSHFDASGLSRLVQEIKEQTGVQVDLASL